MQVRIMDYQRLSCFVVARLPRLNANVNIKDGILGLLINLLALLLCLIFTFGLNGHQFFNVEDLVRVLLLPPLPYSPELSHILEI